MGLYKILHAALTCPRCGEVVKTTVDCYFGYVGEMQELKIGDQRERPTAERRQTVGRLYGWQGLMECPR